MKLYQINVTYTELTPQLWHRTGGLPTFYLRDDMQGIVNAEHAEQIARNMVQTLVPGATVYVSVAVSKDFDPAVIGA